VQANGVPIIAGVGQTVNFAQDSAINACIDTDIDGVVDVADLDDDNDGILDTVECGFNPIFFDVFLLEQASPPLTTDVALGNISLGQTVTLESVTAIGKYRD